MILLSTSISKYYQNLMKYVTKIDFTPQKVHLDTMCPKTEETLRLNVESGEA